MLSGKKFKGSLPPEIDEYAQSLRPRLRTLVVCLSQSWGGLEQIAVNDAMDLCDLGLFTRFLCLEGSPTHEHLVRYKEEGSRVEILPISYRPRDYFDFKLRSELNQIIESDRINLVHCHQPSLLASVVPWLWSREKVVIIASRHIMNRHNKRNPFHALIYKRLDALVGMSETLKANVLATHSIREKQVKVIHYGLDFDLFDPERVDSRAQRAAWGADETTAVIGLVGRIDPAKGQETFIKAAASLMRTPNGGEKFKFVIVGEETLGSESHYLEELKVMVKQFGLEEQVVFAGFQENIPEVMQAFDVFVMPSKQEAFGLVAIEAMAMECPIIISRGGSAEEIIGKEEFGLFTRPDDAFDLQRQLRYLLDHPEERLQMGKKAREHVKKYYDQTVRLRRTLDLYDQMLKKRGL